MSAPQIQYPPTASGGAPVGGSGTSSPSTIPRWTGASTLGDSIIVQNAGGTAIAIGDAAGVSYVGLVQVKRAGGAGWLTLDHTGGSYAEVQSYNVPLYLNRQGNNTILNATSGNVGIGTASPVNHGAGAATLAVNGTSLSMMDWMVNGTRTMAGFAQAAISQFGTVTSSPLAFLTANTERARIDSAGNFILNSANTGATIQAAGTSQGLKLPATPGNADTQTLDAYQEIGTGTPAEIALTLTCGTSGTITVNAASSKARVTRVGNKVIGHGRIVVSSVSAPLGRLSCVLTGCPQPFTNFLVETQTDNTTGLASGNRIVGTSDTAATPTIYFDRYSPNTSSTDAAANIQAGTIIVFNICYSV